MKTFTKLCFALLLLPAASLQAFKIDAFRLLFGIGDSHHENITYNGLDRVRISSGGVLIGFSEEAKNDIAEQNTQNDEGGFYLDELHFDAEKWIEASGKLAELRSAAAASALNENGRADAWEALGIALHILQDFYAHSNYVEYRRLIPNLPLPSFGAFAPFAGFRSQGVSGLFNTSSAGDVCNSNGLNADAGLTTGYYNFVTAYDPALADSYGWSTTAWKLAATENPFSFPLAFSSSWPNGRCVHGTDAGAGAGLNKDQRNREGFDEAFQFAISSTSEFLRLVVDEIQGSPDSIAKPAICRLFGHEPMTDCLALSGRITVSSASVRGANGQAIEGQPTQFWIEGSGLSEPFVATYGDATCTATASVNARAILECGVPTGGAMLVIRPVGWSGNLRPEAFSQSFLPVSSVPSIVVNGFGSVEQGNQGQAVGGATVVGLDTSSGTLRLPLGTRAVSDTFPFIWIANSGEGTISKLDINTGREMGRYRTGPSNVNGNPSRTTVDQNGNVWVGNRNHNTITKIGLVEADQCVDRNGNGVIETSTSSTPLAWGGSLGDGRGVSLSQDECVLQHVPLTFPGVSTPTDIRMLAIDTDNNVFAGGTNVRAIYKVNGQSGRVIDAKNTAGSFYGGFVNSQNELWAVSVIGGVQRVHHVTQALVSTLIDVGIPAYGIAGDKYGKIWVTSNIVPNFVSFEASNPSSTIRRHVQSGRTLFSPYAQGIAVDGDNVYIAGAINHNVVGHYRQRFEGGVFTGTVDLIANYVVGRSPTGVAVDGNGRVWSTNYDSNSVSRIEVGSTPAQAIVTSFPVGLTPYNYSDMTGRVVRSVTARQGTWERTFDSQQDGYIWRNIQWSFRDGLPAGTAVDVTFKAADKITDFGGLSEVSATNGADLGQGVRGRYLKIKIKLLSADPNQTPEITGLVIN
jgi:hypothetical protein